MTAIPRGAPTAASQPIGAIDTQSATANQAFYTQAELTSSSAYREVLEIRPIQTVPDSHELSVRSQLDTARHPEAWHHRYHIAFDTASLERLHRVLGEYLQAIGAGWNIGGCQ